ncbi:alanine/glycine:cation symporter family protein [Hyphomonas sp.]|uniref:alanine/glycine:cation symporter family protein n=1 Tax=Hyphomonas sp. TaxID=87 RepID=UPI0039190D1A
MLADFYEAFAGAVENISNFIWGGEWNGEEVLPFGPMAVILLGTGLFFMIRLGGRPLRRFVPAIVEVWRGRKGNGDAAAITPFQALATALSGQVGTGNIVGVATALTLGGPGAIFWMWITAIFGMALAFAESSLAIKYREIDENGRINGGPMYYIKKGLGRNWTWLAAIFCIGTIFSATATGGMIQANAMTANIQSVAEGAGFSIPIWVLGLILAGLVFAVIIGGIKSIGRVAGNLVPAMAIVYVLACTVILLLNIPHIPGAFGMIFASAFGLESAVGGLAGYGVLWAIRAGVARGLFSNEAGQGSAPIAHAASQMKNPAKQGEIAMIGVFIDTMVLCTMTALVILTAEGTFATAPALLEKPAFVAAGLAETTTHLWMAEGTDAATLTNRAFTDAVPGPVGGWVVTLCLTLFAFTTIIGWSYYAEQATTFLAGEWATKPFRYVWVIIIFIGSLQEVDFIWRFGDIANASMAFPNLIAILLLSGVVYAIHKKNGDPDTADGESIMEDLRVTKPAE